MNKVILLGNLCRDIELRYTKSQKAVMQNVIAVKNDRKNENGEYDSQFINIVAWEQKANYLSQYAKKGSRIVLEGRLITRSYETESGEKKYVTEVICEKVSILDSRKDNNNSTSESKETTDKASNEQSDPFTDFADEIVVTDDDLPF